MLSHTISLLLTAISDSDAASQGCEILHQVIRGVIASDKSSYLQGRVADIICTLIPQATRVFATSSVSGSKDALSGTSACWPLQVIKDLMQALSGLQTSASDAHIRGLPPFPKERIFDEVRLLVETDETGPQGQRLRAWDVNVFLRVFKELKEPVPFEVQKATLVHLHEQLRQHFSKAATSPKIVQRGEAEVVDACIYKLLAWTKMADAYGHAERHHLVELIGKCLGQLGPTLTSALSLRTPLEETLAWSNPRGDLDNFLQKYRINMCVSIIKRLRSYLEDEDVRVVEEAIAVLKGIFNLAEKDDILDMLQAGQDTQDMHTYLTPFFNAGAQSKSAAGPFGASLKRLNTVRPPEPRWATTTDEGLPRTYEEWLCDLAHVLCAMNNNDSLWLLCQRMCQLKLDFAELVFPSLLFSIFHLSFKEGCADEQAAEIGENLTLHIFCEENSCLKAIRLVLQGLDVLRLVKQTVIKHYFKVDSPIANYVRKWSFSYFFHVPYMAVAKAARRSGAHLSALMYLELHSEAWRNDAAVAKDGEYELLLAYRAVEEPDGLDAFNKWRDFRSRFITWQHHGEYAKVDTLV